MTRTAVWITGVGTATSLGNDYASVADALLAGRSGIRAVTSFDASQHPSQIAAQIDAVPCPPGEDPQAFARLQRIEQLTLWCGDAALRDAGCRDRAGDPRVGLVVGVGSEWLLAWEGDHLRGGRRIYEPEPDGDTVLGSVRRRLGLTGPAVRLSAACASGNHALALARRWLDLGWVDVCLAGACDMAVTPVTLAAFGNLRALSRRNAAPQAASRPFDKHRDGFVMGEGGAVFVLERAPDARRRGAKAYAEVVGSGATSDAYHMVIPCPEPVAAEAAMRQALAEAAVEPAGVDYVNAHGTSTPVGDAAEAKALRAVFGEAARTVPVSSTKSMTGHLLTAAASVEAIACLAALERQAVPPTINLDSPDPACELCHVPHAARPARVRVTMSNSFGFGGSNTSLVLRAVA
jgi:3-oxoacyl-[acyl-carrier-protein] synthase II